MERIYDAPLSNDGWYEALRDVAGLFNGSFADIFTRSHDRQWFHGLAYGLDRDDYDGQFLGFWFKRNIWGNTKPTRVAGEVISTREIVDVDALMRSEIYENYLARRDLHEGLRLSLWADARSIQDISILRPWSAGPFGRDEVALGEFLLPHLQRAAALTRRLRADTLARDVGLAVLDRTGLAVFLFYADGSAVPFNVAADTLLRERRVLTLLGGRLQAATPALTRMLRQAVAQASGPATSLRQGSLVRLPDLGDTEGLVNIMVTPLGPARDWALAHAPVAMAVLRDPSALSLSDTRLAALFDLTPAESDLARNLLAGASLREIARETGRSLNTLRNHLAHLMGKTATRKQSHLVRLLMEVAAFAETEATGAMPPGGG